MRPWNDYVDAEPRFGALLEAATALVGTSDKCHAEAVYVMAKPLIGWLVGPGRGRAPRALRGAPDCSRLWAMASVARPFDPTPSWLDGHHAYDHACSHVNELLHQAQQRRQAA